MPKMRNLGLATRLVHCGCHVDNTKQVYINILNQSKHTTIYGNISEAVLLHYINTCHLVTQVLMVPSLGSYALSHDLNVLHLQQFS